MLKYQINKLKSYFYTSLPIVDKGGMENVYVLAGQGRSGTTWMTEVLNKDNSFRYLFEPLNEKKVLGIPFEARLYLRENEERKDLRDYLEKVLSGNVRHRWIDQFNRNRRPEKRLVKFIRVSMILHWMLEQFPSLKVVYVVRNPYQVALSRVTKGWPPNLHLLTGQPNLVEDYLQPHLDLIASASTPFEKHFVSWAVESMVAEKSMKSDRVHWVYYEDLKAQPQEGYQSIFDFYGLEFDADDLEDVLNRPSKMTSKKAGDLKSKTSWKDSLSVGEMDFAKRVLIAFGIDDRWS